MGRERVGGRGGLATARRGTRAGLPAGARVGGARRRYIVRASASGSRRAAPAQVPADEEGVMGESYLDLLMAQQEEPASEVLEEATGGGGVWVVADVLDGEIAPVTLEALGAARSLADSVGAYVYSVILGDGVTDLAQILYQAGADGVHVGDDAALGEFAVASYRQVLLDLFAAEQPEIVLLGATARGQALAPRLAQALGAGLIEHIVDVTLDETTRTVQASFPIYGGEYFEIAASPKARPQFLTVEPGAFPAPFVDTYRRGEPTILAIEPVTPMVRVLDTAADFDLPPVPLSEAAVIVAA
ncbi:MAG TPA: electron transfer flavoprotein subunit alpha/FixB family protein, partial [Chloroflexi bacterium]|nr:electron transfer flavoprotein subunit alpha/FixB family protein [Chloroflexota bacterium]